MFRPDGYTYHEFRAQFVFFSIYISTFISHLFNYSTADFTRLAIYTKSMFIVKYPICASQ